MEIEGKKAVIVGGASGFGRATAESLAKRGASVAVLDRPQSKGREVADAIGGTFHEVDVTDFAGTEQVLQQAVEALGGLHIAVTTAGGGIGERTVMAHILTATTDNSARPADAKTALTLRGITHFRALSG
jgi:NAD(P)-dependent dehydrogenase (short-subunit alcohol dehydrogenase family)